MSMGLAEKSGKTSDTKLLGIRSKNIAAYSFFHIIAA